MVAALQLLVAIAPGKQERGAEGAPPYDTIHWVNIRAVAEYVEDLVTSAFALHQSQAAKPLAFVGRTPVRTQPPPPNAAPATANRAVGPRSRLEPRSRAALSRAE